MSVKDSQKMMHLGKNDVKYITDTQLPVDIFDRCAAPPLVIR
jgi:hypothetical protein